MKSTKTAKSDYNLLTGNKFTYQEKILIFVIFFSLSIACYFYMFQTYMFDNEISYLDLFTQQKFCAYTINGIDAYPYRGTEIEAAPGLGIIDNGFHATPWGSLLGNVFYAGFLPFEQAKIYYFIVSFICLITASYFLFREFSKMSKDLGLMAFFISITSVDILMSVHMGNAGVDICALILILWALCNDHPYISGILLGFAMIKPQTALLVCLTMLLMKKSIPLIIAAVIDIAAWLGTSLLVNKGMIELLREFFIAPKNSVMPNAGIFSLFFENHYFAILSGMLLGIIYVIFLLKIFPKNAPDFFKIYPACVALNFWCYSNIAEGYIRVLPAIICLFIMANSFGKLKRLLWFCLSLYSAFGPLIRSIMRRLLFSIYNISYSDPISGDLPRTLYEFVFILISVLTVMELRRIYRGAE